MQHIHVAWRDVPLNAKLVQGECFQGAAWLEGKRQKTIHKSNATRVAHGCCDIIRTVAQAADMFKSVNRFIYVAMCITASRYFSSLSKQRRDLLETSEIQTTHSSIKSFISSFTIWGFALGGESKQHNSGQVQVWWILEQLITEGTAFWLRLNNTQNHSYCCIFQDYKNVRMRMWPVVVSNSCLHPHNMIHSASFNFIKNIPASMICHNVLIICQFISRLTFVAGLSLSISLPSCLAISLQSALKKGHRMI